MISEMTKSAVLAHASRVIGGDARSLEFANPAGKSTLQLKVFENRPWKGVNTYLTAGLCAYPMIQDGKEFPVRVEMLSAAYDHNDEVSFVLAEAGFSVMNKGMMCSPGSVLPGAVKKVGISSTMEHAYFTAPYLWDNQLGSLKIGALTAAWVLAFPISDAEFKYCKRAGVDALESKFTEYKIDIFDINRQSVI